MISWAFSHMSRQATTVATGVSLSHCAAASVFRKACMGRQGDRNQAW